MVSVGVIKVRCDACLEVIKGKYVHFSDGSIFCQDCFQYLPKCRKCKKPILGGENKAIDGLCGICFRRAPKCDICEKPIIGGYTRFEDKSIACDDCRSNFSKCDRCGKPVARYTSIRGKILCKYCLSYAPRCSVCNNPIIGSFWIFDTEKVCDYCTKIYDRCNICGIPNQFLFTVHDKKICYVCQESAKRCSACGLPIIGRNFFYKNKEGIFCEHCESSTPHCDSCGRPVGIKYISLSDGRNICLECKRTAITTERQLKELVETAFDGLDELGLDITHTINYRMVSKQFLDRKIKETGAAVASGKNLGLFHRKDDKMIIYLQTHLPIQLALGTLSHELAHAWQSENLDNTAQDRYLQEGFCEWVSYKVLMKFGFHNQANTILSRDDLYGLGFQKFQRYEKKYGIKALLEWAKSAQK